MWEDPLVNLNVIPNSNEMLTSGDLVPAAYPPKPNLVPGLISSHPLFGSAFKKSVEKSKFSQKSLKVKEIKQVPKASNPNFLSLSATVALKARKNNLFIKTKKGGKITPWDFEVLDHKFEKFADVLILGSDADKMALKNILIPFV